MPRHRRPRRKRRTGRDRGSVTAELTIAIPLLGLMCMLVINFGLYFHGRHIAEAAASEALAAARADGGSAAAGNARGDQILTDVGRGVLKNPKATVTRTRQAIDVVVTGHIPQLLPFLTLPVIVREHGLIEGWTR